MFPRLPVRPAVLAAVLLALSAWLRAPVHARADEITGGFGLELGAEYDTSKALSQGRSISNDLYYLIDPPAPEAPLERYGLHVTPATHRIAVIFGVKEYPELGACNLERAKFRDRLARLYGKPFVARNIPGALQFGTAPRFAMLECKGDEAPYLFQVTYADVEMMMLFRNERDGLGR